MDIKNIIALIAVVVFGFYSINKIFKHMKDGFGPLNIRITGIVIVATLSSILAIIEPSGQSSAIGILGVIAGYLFGYQKEN